MPSREVLAPGPRDRFPREIKLLIADYAAQADAARLARLSSAWQEPAEESIWRDVNIGGHKLGHAYSYADNSASSASVWRDCLMHSTFARFGNDTSARCAVRQQIDHWKQSAGLLSSSELSLSRSPRVDWMTFTTSRMMERTSRERLIVHDSCRISPPSRFISRRTGKRSFARPFDQRIVSFILRCG